MTLRARPPYVLGEALGEGGYSEVFRASPRAAEGPVVALKRAKRNADALARMAREIEVLRQIDHPHVMPLLDAAADASWFVMPLAQGNLDDLVTQSGLGGDREGTAISITDEIGLGLQHAHEHGYVHRDVSPDEHLALDRWWAIAMGRLRLGTREASRGDDHSSAH